MRSTLSAPMSPTEPNFVASTFLADNAKLESIAVANPNKAKDTSEAEAIATPAKMGIKDKYTAGWNTSFRMTAVANAVAAGSKAFTTCVNDTAIELSDATVQTCATAKKAATGTNVQISAFVMTGNCTKPNAHIKTTIGQPAKS
mmetsp:Transcript_9114/g.17417  ORF Transcript_9114/g.17417 Transcript_9114/m.17417 type:complete len:144 (+) Transcript_9114:463-894(+)